MTRYEQEYYATVISELPKIRKALQTNTEMKAYLNYVLSCIDKQVVPNEVRTWRITKED